MTPQTETHLSWGALKHTEGDIPWPALQQFAESLVKEPELWKRLADAFSTVVTLPNEEPDYDFLYLPAILAMAAPRLEEPVRGEIGAYFVQELVRSAEDGDELLADVLVELCGKMGPGILPAVLEELSNRPNSLAADYLWNLTALAEDTQAPEMRDAVIALCSQELYRADREGMGLVGPTIQAWTLARLGCTEAIPLMRQLAEKAPAGDIQEAAKYLEGDRQIGLPPKPGHKDIRQWLESNVVFLRDWYTRRNIQTAEDTGPRETLDLPDAGQRRMGDDDVRDPGEWRDPEAPTYQKVRKAAEHRLARPDLPDPPSRETEPALHSTPKVGRNDPCPCGSGKKYKKCCGQ